MNMTRTLHRAALAGLGLGCAALTFLYPDACREAIEQALQLCGQQLLPALFPFLVVAGLVAGTGCADLLGFFLRPVSRWMRLPDEAAGVILIGWVSGFAPAAAAAARLLRNGRLTAAQTAQLLPVCVCSGPSFVVLAVGGMLGSLRLGWLLYASQLGGCLACALALRRGTPAAADASAAPAAPVSLYQTLTGAADTFVRLCGVVLFFRFLSGGLSALLPEPAALLPTLFLEVSAGSAAAAAMGPGAVYWCGAVLSLQSLSVFLQVRALVPPSVSLGPLVWTRLLHLPVSLLLLRGFLALLPPQDVYSSLAPRILTMQRSPTGAALCLFVLCCCTAVRLHRTLQGTQNSL